MVSDQVDVSELAASLKGSFELWAARYLLSHVIVVPGLAWLGWAGVSALALAALTGLVSFLTDSAILDAFFLNTAYQKAGEARAYLAAVATTAAVSSEATNEEYAVAEEAEILAFSKFVRL